MIFIPEEKKSKFGKILGLFKKKKEATSTEKRPVPKTVEMEAGTIPKREVEEKIEEEAKKKAKAEKKAKVEELKKRYEIMEEGIPQRRIEEVPTMPEKPIEREGEEVRLSDLVLKLEKLDGRLEMLERSRSDANERITGLAGEIGELRTMILERERSIDKIATEFEKVRDTVEGLEPEEVKKTFEKSEEKVLKNMAKLERIENLVKALSEESKKYRRLMEKIKSFENIVDVSYDINRKVSEIRKTKDYADKIASKTESIFSELNRKVSEIENERERIEHLDKLTVEITKMLDELSVRLNKYVKEKDLKEFREEIKEDVGKLLKGKLPRVRIEGNKWIQAKLSELSSDISKLKSVVESQNSVIMDIIERLEGRPETTERA